MKPVDERLEVNVSAYMITQNRWKKNSTCKNFLLEFAAQFFVWRTKPLVIASFQSHCHCLEMQNWRADVKVEVENSSDNFDLMLG